MKVIDARWLLASLVAAVVAITGCGTSGETEGKGSSTQKILTPVASIQTPASKETRAAFGIVEWKIFRSKSDLHMTGYDANGKAVKGITTGFAKSANGGDTELRTKINDGSKFKALHNFRAKTNKATSKTLATDSAAFVNAAMTDAGKIHTLFKAKAKTAAKAPTAAATSAQCGADLSGIMSKALQCMQGKANTKAQQAACIAAAKTAAASSSSCKSTGATTPAPAKASAPKSSGAAKKSSNSSAKKSSGSKGSTAKKDSTKKTDDAKDDDDDLDDDDLDDDDEDSDDDSDDEEPYDELDEDEDVEDDDDVETGPPPVSQAAPVSPGRTRRRAAARPAGPPVLDG